MDNHIRNLVSMARTAQKRFENDFDQERVDAIVRNIAKVVYLGAEKWAKLALEETGMGNYEDKVQKKKAKARIMWSSLRGKKSMGIISRDETTGIVEIAKPVGVVGAAQPCTNPIVTAMANCMAALKGKNAIIIAPHPRAVTCTSLAVKEWRDAIRQSGAPEDILQILENSSVERTSELMRSVDVIVATGGPAMVKTAYSSGKPSYGVGPGNVQCILDRGINIADAVAKIITGRTFDNGIVCSGEQSVIVPHELYQDLVLELKKQNVFVVEAQNEREKLVKVLFPDGKIDKNLIGQPALRLAEKAALRVPSETVMIAVLDDERDKKSLLRHEKMFPVVTVFCYETLDQALAIVEDNLAIAGKGHSVVIHSQNRENIERVGLIATVSRVIVNAPCSTTVGGSFKNGLGATSTLGCGTWGNNSISENFTYKHLLNITRIAYVIPSQRIPSDDELFGGE
jgi:succinate-semialdehyde dehydrogenase